MTLTAFGGYLQTAVRDVATLINFQVLYYRGEERREINEVWCVLIEYAGKFQTDLGKAWAAEIVSRRQRRSIKPQEPVL
jgi:hypothetical protein